MAYQKYNITWNGVEIEARYDPLKHGGVIAHLEVQSVTPPRAPLPITKTGYRSHFHTVGTIERDFDGDVVAAVVHWLDGEATSKEWQLYVESTQQYALF